MTAAATLEPGIQGASWRAIGTNVDLVTFDGDLERARTAVEDVVEAIDRACSTFRPDSELARLNAAPGRPTRISPLLARAIGEALRAAELTAGRCDPTVGRALLRIGYADDVRAIPQGIQPVSLRVERAPGWRSLGFDPVAGTLTIPPGVSVDLGATGKAFAADLAADAALGVQGRGGVLVSLGGDVAVAGAAPEGGWRILVTDDSAADPEGPGDVITIEAGAVATSSTTVRRWRRGNIELHHLIDPSTGLPARSPWRTVSVLAATCVDANAASTAALIAGDAGPDWLIEIGLAARFVGHDGAVVRVAGWPEPA